MMKRMLSIIIFSLCLSTLASKADIVWSGPQGHRLSAFDPSLDLDINDDGMVDFLFPGILGSINYSFEPLDGNAGLSVLGKTYDPLVAGFSIGPDIGGHSWRDDKRQLLIYMGPEGGSEVGGGSFYDTNAYLGVSFQIDAETHYGWIHLIHDNETTPRFSLTIQDWAWESEPDTAILAGAIPEPSTGILTMVGSVSLLYIARTRRLKQEKLPSIPKYRPTAVNDPATF